MCGRACATEIDVTEGGSAKGPGEAGEPGTDETRTPLAGLDCALEGPLCLLAVAVLLVKPEVGVGIDVVHGVPPGALRPSIEDVEDTLGPEGRRDIRRSEHGNRAGPFI